MITGARRIALHCCLLLTPPLVLIGCSTQPVQPSPPSHHRANTGTAGASNGFPNPANIPPDVADTPNAAPQWAPRSRYGNPVSYTVGDKTYDVLNKAAGFTQEGYASWYGKKFQGKPTASGQPYDMFKMTAAHKTLPIPSYVKVTNLRNHKSAVVRINDRGPFHKGRIIDLSYAAAAKLGMLKHGSAPVKLKVITRKPPTSPDVPPELVEGKLQKVAAHAASSRTGNLPSSGHYLQVGVFLDHDNAAVLRDRLQNVGISKTHLVPANYAGAPATRVLVGPLKGSDQLQAVREKLADNGIPSQPIYR